MDNFEITYDIIENSKKNYKRKKNKINYLYLALSIFIVVGFCLWLNTRRRIEEMNRNSRVIDAKMKELRKDLNSITLQRESLRADKKEKEDRKILLEFQIKVLSRDISVEQSVLDKLKKEKST